LRERQAALAWQERKHARYAWARLGLLGVAAGILLVGGLGRSDLLIAPAAAFLVLAVAHARVLNARDRAQTAVSFYERALARVAGAWMGTGRTGADLAPADHLFAADLDLFGRASLFELLATSRTHAGDATLARWMLAPAPPDVIRARQAAIVELAPRIDLREQVAVLGNAVRLAVHPDVLARWSRAPVELRGRGMRILLAVLAAGTAGSLGWALWSGEGTILLSLFALAQLAAAAWYKARVAAVVSAVDEPAHDLGVLAGLLASLEREPVASPYLRDLQQRVATSGRPASAEIGRLSTLVAMLSSRSNLMFAALAGVLLWATQWAFAIEAWRARAGVRVPDWLDAIGEFEAILALSAYAAEHPSTTMPVVEEARDSVLETRALAHPLLGDAAVANDVALDAATGPALLIVSGSNMSGKSTLLRAIGVNVVLAGMGAPVRAGAFRMTPLDIGASIRVTDSLADGRSRFMAEVVRLKAIVDLATARRGAVLFMLDEILSGTNSHDRRIGAEAVLASLVASGAIGLATTHDLALGEIAAARTGAAVNVHFEDTFEDGALVFDYRLKPGIVRTSNALRLMRAAGLNIDNEDAGQT